MSVYGSGLQLSRLSELTRKVMSTNSVGEYIARVDLEVYHVEGEGLDEAEDGLAIKTKELCELVLRMLMTRLTN